MKSSALLRLSVLLSLLALLPAPASRAGSVNAVFGTEYNERFSSNDDLAIQVPLRWYDGAEVKFYYMPNNDGSVLSTDILWGDGRQVEDPREVLSSVRNALHRWNTASYASARKFKLMEALVPVNTMGYQPIPDTIGLGYRPESPGVDGYNVIAFQPYNTAVGGTGITLGNGVPAATIISYFTEDFDLTKFVNGTIIEPQLHLQVLTNQGGQGGGAGGAGGTLVYTQWNFPGQLQGGGGAGQVQDIPRMYVFFPLRDYKQGEIFDVDIILNDNLVGEFRPWPQTSVSQLTASQRDEYETHMDLEMIFMHEFGWALGLGNSMIFDSVMYPYYYYRVAGGTAPAFATNQFRKRLLSFDDEMTAGIAWGAKFPSTLGAISGQVLDGATIGALTPLTQGQQQTGQQGQQGQQQQPQPTQPNQANTQDPFLAQVPVFVGVKNTEISKLPTQLTRGRADLSINHFDNINAVSPYHPSDLNNGIYRMLAHVLSGQNLALPASQGPTQTGAGTGGNAGGGNGPTIPTTGQTTTNVPGPDLGTISQVSRINGLYTIPALPDRDVNGQPINYAVYLPSNIRNGAANTYFLNLFRSQFIPTQPTQRYTFPNEFYGGLEAPLEFGRGDAPIVINALDDEFMSNYIIGEMDLDGRIAAAINQGPGLLSGYNLGPLSFVVFTMGNTFYTNRTGPIARNTQPVVVTDTPVAVGQVQNAPPNTAIGAWEEFGKFRIRAELKLSSSGGLAGIPAGLEMVYTVTNISTSSAACNLRQVLDTNVFGRENPVFLVNNQFVNNSTSYQGAKIPRQIVFQSWSTSSTAVRGWLEVVGGNNTTPSWVTIGTLPELNKILGGPGANLRDAYAQSLDSGIAIGWNFNLAANERKQISFTLGYFPGGVVKDSWFNFPTTAPAAGTTLSGVEDDPYRIETVNVTAGQTTDGIDIYTNTFTGTAPPATTARQEGTATGLVQFIRLSNGFPDYKTFYTTGGALGDLDNDGDLDAVTCARNGSTPAAGSVNRIYLNEVRINSDGSVARYFRDVTLGDDVNNPSTYRLQPLHQGEDSFGVVLGDFDDDGWLEIFFTKRGAQHTYYDNLGPDKPGYFVEDEAAVPGLLNGPRETALDLQAFRATAGDIDCDGDLDLIISQFEPFFTDAFGWMDTDGGQIQRDFRMSHSRDHFTDPLLYCERVLINYKYTPQFAAGFNQELRQDRTDQLGTYFIDETLGTDDAPGTLTSLHTERFDNLAQYQFVVSWDPSEIDRMPPLMPHVYTYNDANLEVTGVEASPMAYHAVEPRLGPLFGGSGLDLMSVRTDEPIMIWSGLHPVPVTDAFSPAPPAYVVVSSSMLDIADTAYDGTDSAFFRNLDLFHNRLSPGTPMEVVGDGTPDGYFACMNYGMDYGTHRQPMVSSAGPQGIETRLGMFVYEEDSATSSNRALFRYDAFPLFIGFPEGDSSDAPKTPPFPGADVDNVPGNGGRTAYAGVIGDWEHRGRPLPMIVSDISNTAANANHPYVFTVNDGSITYSDWGYARGSTVGIGGTGPFLYGGIATQYVDAPIYPYSQPTTQERYTIGWVLKLFAQAGSQTGDLQDGQPYGAVAGDFDCDGDEDVFWVNSGTLPLGSGTNTKAPKQIFLNDSFANFTEATGALSPNEAVHGMYCAGGDLDNDGDLDLVSFNMLGPNEVYFNQSFTAPPNLLDDKDPTLFFDATYKCIPNIGLGNYDGNIVTPPPFSGVNVAAAVADLNLDRRPDLLLADGGRQTVTGDYARVLINAGQPVGDAVQIFKPGGAAYPPPRTDLWVHNLTPVDGRFTEFNGVKFWGTIQRDSERFYRNFLQGYLGGPKPGFINDLQAGDADGDGDLDLLIVRAGGGTNQSDGPQLVINTDSDEQYLNSQPDADSKGDAIFSEGNLIRLTDPGQPGRPSSEVFKNQGQRARFADFNRDGMADIIIANGYPEEGPDGRGAPNVLLMNNRPVAGRFADETETRLPTVTQQGITHGKYDNSLLVVVGDFDNDGDVDTIFGNEVTTNAPLGFRMLLNNGQAVFSETAQGQRLPTFSGRKPRGMGVADIDGLGEPTEDKNFNGLLDPGEDTNGNGLIDWTDLATEIEDLNFNGQLDAGEDGRIGAANGKLDYRDANNDGVYTVRRNGVWEGSLDVVVSFDDNIPALLINEKTGRYPGYFVDEGMARLFDVEPGPDRGLDIGDVNLDGYPDIVISRYVGGITFPVTLWLNQPQVSGGKVKWGYFKNASYEVPYPRGENTIFEVTQNIIGPNDASVEGWWSDVKLLDADGDGDLDMFVAAACSPNLPHTAGAMDAMYLNRIVGDGFNFKGYEAQRNKINPSVYSIWPRGAERNTLVDVQVAGDNFQSGMVLSFGPGVAVQNVQKVNASLLNVKLQVSATAPLGPRAVLVQNPSGSPVASKVGLFNVYEKAPNDVDDRAWTLYN